ncbi:MAG: hypothetical protein HY216_06535, partial [Candidatus Rokubacteria bacterium]|nr:hypothetical protein [Candidatus Rokubacteria bacterium]
MIRPSHIAIVLASLSLSVARSATAGWVPNGVPLCSSPCASDLPNIVTDGAGGGIVMWRHYAGSGVHNVVLQRITAEGDIAPGWPADGVPASTDPHNHSNPGITADGDGGVIVAWEDYRSVVNPPYLDIYAQRVTASGTIAPGWNPDGVRLTGAPNGQISPRVCSDGTGGALVTWEDYRSGSSNPDIYAQHVTGAGTIAPGWPVDGLLIAGGTSVQNFPAITADGAGGALIVWRDGSGALFGQRITSAGAVAAGWPTSGVVVCPSPGWQDIPHVVSDGAGGAIVGWEDARTAPPGTYDPSYEYANIYAQHVTASGTISPGWPVDGLPVCLAPHTQHHLSIAADGVGGVLMAWEDYRA